MGEIRDVLADVSTGVPCGQTVSAVVAEESETADVIRKAEWGIVVKPRDVAGIRSSVLRLRENVSGHEETNWQPGGRRSLLSERSAHTRSSRWFPSWTRSIERENNAPYSLGRRCSPSRFRSAWQRIPTSGVSVLC